MPEISSTVTRKNRLMQIEVFPQRLLNFETARELLNELNKVGGITRMIVHGPRMPRGDPDEMLKGKFDSDKKYLDIMGEKVELTVQVGRVWIEVEDAVVVKKIREACEKVLPMPFEINEGAYIRTRKTITDYVRKGGKVDDISVGLNDPKARPQSSCCERK
jgi:methyl-coenzyme M reductase subunit D